MFRGGRLKVSLISKKINKKMQQQQRLVGPPLHHNWPIFGQTFYNHPTDLFFSFFDGLL
jgi:hypothetical protein